MALSFGGGFVVIGLYAGRVRQSPRFPNSPVASLPPKTLHSLPSELKLTPCERLERAGLLTGLKGVLGG